VSIEKELPLKRFSLTLFSLVLAAAIAASGASAKRMHSRGNHHSVQVRANVHNAKYAARFAYRAQL
jgi:hypothetical protein